MTVIVGANAAGKSNFIQVQKLFRDVATHGLANAVSLQGGIKYLRNVRSESSTTVVGFTYEIGAPRTSPVTVFEGALYTFRPQKHTYELKLALKPMSYSVASERMSIGGDILRFGGEKVGGLEPKTVGRAVLDLSRDSAGKVKHRFRLPRSMKRIDRASMMVLRMFDFLPKPDGSESMLETGVSALPWGGILDDLRRLKVFNFDPRLSKQALKFTGTTDLDEEGRNLALSLKRILDKPATRKRFSRLLRDVLPFIDEVSIQPMVDASLLINMDEIRTTATFRAATISDGTIMVMALIVALFFEDLPLIVIEEPERNIHPSLISRIIDLARKAASDKQIILTTHSPEVVRGTDLESLVLIRRRRSGFSEIGRPSESKHVAEFLKNEIGIDELYIQNLLDG